MGRQIQVYLTGADIERLEMALRSKVPFAAMRYTAAGPRAAPVATLAVEEMGKTPLTVFLARPEDLAVVHCREVPAQHYWVVDEMTQPVVEFSRSYFDSRVLRRGRFYYQPGLYDGSGRWVEKPPAFLDWAERLFRVIRKSLRRHATLDAYLGLEAEKLHAEKRVELVSL